MGEAGIRSREGVLKWKTDRHAYLQWERGDVKEETRWQYVLHLCTRAKDGSPLTKEAGLGQLAHASGKSQWKSSFGLPVFFLGDMEIS